MGNDADLPRRIGVYTIERVLGAGGMGTVYLARSRGGRAVAVKVARPELAADRRFRERFRAEVEAARAVGGFHTAPVVDADPDAEAPWLATAYVPGPTLSELLAEQGPMDEGRLRLLGAALAEALQAVHACGLVHRDLKPGNVIMAADGPRVLDFGIARAMESTRLTTTGTAFGTPGYLAPEQAQGLEVDGSADVFALGAVLVAAAGGSAFGAGTPMGVMYRTVHEPADLSAVPDNLRSLVAACLSKNPGDRPAPGELLDLLMPDPARTEPVPVAPGTPGPTVPLPAPAPPAAPAPASAAASGPPAAPVPADAAGAAGDGEGPRGAGGASGGPARRPRTRMIAVVPAAAVVVAALAGGTYYLTHHRDGQGTPSAAASQSGHTSSPNPNSSPKSDPKANPASSPSAGNGAAAAPANQVTVVISGKEEGSWISAKGSGGQVLFEGVLSPGERKTFTDRTKVDLILGNAGAVRLVVNGKEVRDGLPPGQVVRLTYTRSD
ncbi:RodZ domain-containing protein [Streptomyces sp. NPDC003374]